MSPLLDVGTTPAFLAVWLALSACALCQSGKQLPANALTLWLAGSARSASCHPASFRLRQGNDQLHWQGSTLVYVTLQSHAASSFPPSCRP